MASPPYSSYSPTALSPPPSQSFGSMSSGKKRPSDGLTSTPSFKRRKPSAPASAAGSAAGTHPLRQTSFPPAENDSFYDGGARSPSVDSASMVSGSQSQVSAAFAGSQAPLPVKKKRGRKSKAEKAAMREQTPSVVGDRARTVVSGVSDNRGRSKAPGGGEGGGGDEEDENIELDRAEVQVAATTQALTAEQKEEEHRLKNMLVNAFSSEQFDRYENWRASGFSKSTVRKVGFGVLPCAECLSC